MAPAGADRPGAPAADDRALGPVLLCPMPAKTESSTTGDLALPVLDRPRRIRRSRIGPWRAGVLIAVQIAIIIHIVQWYVSGYSLGAVEPSETMYTLEQGRLTAGAVFLGLTILSVLIVGRYMCGWLCHIVMLQDFCGWLMGKAGIRPRPFRSRLLVFVPLILGLYMFVWPSFKRFVLQPAVEAAGLDWPGWLRRVEPFYGIKNELFVDDLWAHMPTWSVAIPFLLVCGFATVYFLGSKAYCTYACPYGGIFGVLDPVAPLRVRVDHDKCKGCAHCTAACTSNVRVHEEIRDYGMVVDPGCLKTMDCISVCPNDALSIAPGRPACGAKVRDEARDAHAKAVARRESRYDLTWPGEIAAGVVFFVLFFSTRGMFDRVPMLMAGGLAAVGTGLSVLLWKMLTGPNARIHGLTLRHKGRFRPAGVVFTLLMLVGWAFAAWGGAGNFSRWRAETLHAGIGIPIDAILRTEFTPGGKDVRRARAAIAWYARADSPRRGGVGWSLTPDDKVRLAYLRTLLGETDRAVALLRDVVEHGNPTDSLVFQMLNLHGRAAAEKTKDGIDGRPILEATEEQVEMMKDILRVHPALHGVRLRLSQLLWNMGRYDPGVWDVDDESLASDPDFLLKKGQMLAIQRDRAGMNGILDKVLEADPEKPATLLSAAQLAFSLGRGDDAGRLIDKAIEANPDAANLLQASRIYGSAGRLAEAKSLVDRAVDASGARRPSTKFEIGKLLLAHGEADRAVPLMLDAAGSYGHDPWQRLGVAFALTQIGFDAEQDRLRDRGLEMFAELVREEPDEPIFRHDYAGWLFRAGRKDEAAEQIIRAAELAPASVILAERAAQLLRLAGLEDEAVRWDGIAESRKASSGNGP